jgi:hypothetical protein
LLSPIHPPLGDFHLFRSLGLRSKLKSPMISHSVSLGISITLNQLRKLFLSSVVQGAYIFVKIQETPETVDANSMLRAYLFWKVMLPLNLLLFHTVRMPPEAPIDGTYSKESKEGGISFFMYVASKKSLLVS